MNNWRNTIAKGLVVCLLLVSFADSLGAAAAADPASIKRQVDEFGVGAKVGVRLAGGEKLRGCIEGVDEQAFLFAPERQSPPRRIAYDQVAQLKLAKRTYRASDQPDPAEAKRVVLALGVGKHVVVKTGAKKLHGHILAIEADHFRLLPDSETAPVQIPYSDVWYAEKNLSFGATVVLVVLILAAVVVAASVAATR